MAIQGYKRPLEDKDLWSLNEDDTSKTIVQQLSKEWDREKAECKQKEDVSYVKKSNHVLNHVGDGPEEAEVLIRDKKHNRKPSFLKALLRTFGPYFLIGSFFKLIQDLLSFVNPQLLRLVYSVSSFSVQSLWRLGFGTGCLFLKCRGSFPHSATCVCSLTFPLQCHETGVLCCGLSCKLDKLH